MMRFRTLLMVTAILTFVLSGCGFKLVDLGPAPDLYDLNPQPHFDQAMTPVTWQLLVDEPSSTSVLDTDRILVREGGIASPRWHLRPLAGATYGLAVEGEL